MDETTGADRAVLIRRYLLTSELLGTRRLVSAASRAFGVTRQAIHRHLAAMVDEEILSAEGRTRARTYHLRALQKIDFGLELGGLDEHSVWREHLHPLFQHVPGNAAQIALTCFTEMLNNAIDHSEGRLAYVVVQRSAVDVRIAIADDGVGIFRKIMHALQLDEIQHSVLELAKGKFSTSPDRHSGMGVLVTSLACDQFGLTANGLHVAHARSGGRECLFDNIGDGLGTIVDLTILLDTPVTMKSVYDQLDTPEHPGFTRTVIPLSLAEMGNDNLVSRSQAKRVLAGIDRFMEVVLDFEQVPEIGQGFADEIFRVFRIDNPHVNIVAVNAAPDVDLMIQRANAAYNEWLSRQK